jgi:hypothetical protein
MIALLLLPIMVKTAKEFGTQPRITFTSSELHNTMAGDVKPEAQAAPTILEKMSDKSYCTTKSVASVIFVLNLTNVSAPIEPWARVTLKRSCSTSNSSAA